MTKREQKTVWITRTLPSALESGAVFKRAGFLPVIAPLLKVIAVPAHSDIAQDCVLVFTAQNGVRAFAAAHERRGNAVICVGDATAALARELGFTNVTSAKGTARDIAPLIARAPQADKIYLHISGEHVRGQVCADIEGLGLRARRLKYYRSEPAGLAGNVDLPRMDFAALFSPLAAKTLAGLKLDMSHISAVSLSPAVDAELDGMTLKSRFIAAAPTLESLIAAARASE